VFDVIRKCVYLIGRGERARWLGLMLLAALASAVEMAGALLVFLLLGLLADPSGELALPVVGDLRNAFGGVDDADLLLGMAAVMAFFFVLRALVQIGVTYAQQRVAHKAGARLSNRLAAGYLELPYPFHLRRNTSELIANANPAVMSVVGNAYLPMIRVAADSMITIGLVAIMFVVSPLGTSLAIVVVGSAAAILLAVVQPRLKRIGKTAYHANERTIGTMQQSLHGVRDIKLLHREDHFAKEYAANRDRLARAAYLKGTATELPRTVLETALIGFILGFFVVALYMATATEQILSVLGLFAYAGLRMQPSLNHVISGINSIKFATSPVGAVYSDLRLIEQTVRPPGHVARRPFANELVLRDVSFRYEGADHDALRNVDLVIRRGETIGICGPTGSGKTTLVDLISGLLEPTEGQISIDGNPLGDDLGAWQASLGVVPQMVFLTNDTLRRNIALGVPDQDVDDEAVAEAVSLAQLDDFVSSLADGLDAVVGERGVRISGGQRQRIAIARAVYRKPEVLILDEGTSALDNSTESSLMSALNHLRGRHTIILVAHRLSTVRACDRVAYVEDGRLAGLGTFDDLVLRSEGFRSLAHA
jgi:ATP-binding cassette, subfamily B, bacterial PglK